MTPFNVYCIFHHIVQNQRPHLTFYSEPYIVAKFCAKICIYHDAMHVYRGLISHVLGFWSPCSPHPDVIIISLLLIVVLYLGV